MNVSVCRYLSLSIKKKQTIQDYIS